MRTWSLHIRYADRVGKSRCYGEGRGCYLAQLGLPGGRHKKHTQYIRFQRTGRPLEYLSLYLWYVHDELVREGMVRDGKFSTKHLIPRDKLTNLPKLPVTSGQLKFEAMHLRHKLAKRGAVCYVPDAPAVHPLFFVVPGGIEDWERTHKHKEYTHGKA